MLRYGGYKGGALEGRDWFEKAAHKGSAEAWRYLAIWEYHGYGGDRSSTKYRSDFAHHMLRKAIEAGDEEARRLEIPLIKSNFVNFDVKDLLKRKGVKFDEDGFPLN